MRIEDQARAYLHKCIPIKFGRWNTSINPSKQLEMFDEYDQAKPNVAMGWFYEILTALLWGGRVLNQRPINISGRNGDELVVKPDVWHNQFSIGESKACRTGHSCNLYDRQINRYRELQYNNPSYRIYFAFYRHHHKKIHSWKGTEKELFQDLAGATAISMVLSFSIVEKMYESIKKAGRLIDVGVRYDVGYEHPRCVVSSPALNRFFFEPRRMLKYIGLDPEDYFIRYHILASNLYIDGARVNRFPIVRIKDKKHNEWFRKWDYEKMKDVPF